MLNSFSFISYTWSLASIRALCNIFDLRLGNRSEWVNTFYKLLSTKNVSSRNNLTFFYIK
ncbi:hypothetical protein Hanom_Chr17g01547401 [Helianthus anomalus]